MKKGKIRRRNQGKNYKKKTQNFKPVTIKTKTKRKIKTKIQLINRKYKKIEKNNTKK